MAHTSPKQQKCDKEETTVFCGHDALELFLKLNEDRQSTQRFTDGILECQSHQFHVNRCVLAAFSNALKNLFLKGEKIVHLPWCNSKTLSETLHFIYTENLSISRENVEQLSAFAEKFEVPYIDDYCKRFVSDKNYLSSAKSKRYKSDHSRKILGDLNKNRLDHQLYCDVSIVCKKQVFYAHKCVICLFSSFFEKLFTTKMREQAEGVVTINNISSSAMESVLNFIYSNKIIITEDTVICLLESAEYLQVSLLKIACSNFLMSHLSPKSFLSYYLFSQQYELHSVLNQAIQFFFYNLTSIMKENYFNSISFSVLVNLLLNKRPASCEDTVYKAAAKWIRHDIHGRKHFMQKLLDCIHIENLTQECLQSDVLVENLLTESSMNMQSLLKGLLKHVPTKESQEILVFGYNLYPAQARTWKYDVILNKWFILPEKFSAPFEQRSSIAQLKDKIYAMGGYETNETCILNPYSYLPQWQNVMSMIKARENSRAASLNGYVYVTGGQDVAMEGMSSCECYDPDGDKWHLIADMSAPRFNHGLVACNGFLYVMGGASTSEENVLDTVERYDPVSNEWTSLEPMSCPRNACCSVVFEGHIFVIGGYNEEDEWLKSVEKYSIETNSWVSAPSLNEPRAAASAYVVNRKICVIGGEYDGRLLSIELYDPESKLWELRSQLAEYMTIDSAVSI